jgi:hypothetical protein
MMSALKNGFDDIAFRARLFLLLDRTGCRHVADLVVSDEVEKLHLDYVLISSRGILVVQVFRADGKIFVGEGDAEWTQVESGTHHHFESPLAQCARSVTLISKALNVAPDAIQAVTLFRGDCEFIPDVPAGVLYRHPIRHIASIMESRKRVWFSADEVDDYQWSLMRLKERREALDAAMIRLLKDDRLASAAAGEISLDGRPARILGSASSRDIGSCF